MDDKVVSPPTWQCFDNCPICKALLKAHEKEREVSQEEMEKAVAEAEAEK